MFNDLSVNACVSENKNPTVAETLSTLHRSLDETEASLHHIMAVLGLDFSPSSKDSPNNMATDILLIGKQAAYIRELTFGISNYIG